MSAKRPIYYCGFKTAKNRLKGYMAIKNHSTLMVIRRRLYDGGSRLLFSPFLLEMVERVRGDMKVRSSETT